MILVILAKIGFKSDRFQKLMYKFGVQFFAGKITGDSCLILKCNA